MPLTLLLLRSGSAKTSRQSSLARMIRQCWAQKQICRCKHPFQRARNKVLATPPFAVSRSSDSGMEGIAMRVNQNLKMSFSFRACRGRTSLLLRKYTVRKKRNEGASGRSEVHTDDDGVLEQLQKLKDAASTSTELNKIDAESKTQILETAGQKLMQAAEERVSKRIDTTDEKSAKPKRRRLSTLLESEQEEAIERRKIEEQMVELQREELQLRRDELEQQHQHDLLREQMQCHATQTESIRKL
ncbi:hypothetical protein F443_12522 [Phytophthora nicotianae P1569]|uniref:Uncharacterized protein n=6 Tax=Phytophthora nicotianae TaxID=4792 RepID=V9EST1_PHYNI|nr:hypothetical protein F443_12522 [Phytophthora nicotianae P1569]